MAPSLESLEAKLDRVLSKLDELEAVQGKVYALEQTVLSLNATVDTLNREVLVLKELTNNREQQGKSCSVRLAGLCSIEEEDNDQSGKALCKRVYDLIVRPVLVAAKTNKHIDAVPNLNNTISSAYRVRGGGGPSRIVCQPAPSPASPQAIIIKFTSPTVRMAFLRNKKANLPPPSEADIAVGTKRFSVVEDLTGPTYKKLREMTSCKFVDKVWSVEGRLRYTRTGDKTVRKVKSVFMSLEDIIKSS